MRPYVKLFRTLAVVIIIKQTIKDTHEDHTDCNHTTTNTVIIPLRHRNVRKSSVATFRSGNKHLGVYDGGRHFTSGVEQDGLAPFDANFLCARIFHELQTFIHYSVASGKA